MRQSSTHVTIISSTSLIPELFELCCSGLHLSVSGGSILGGVTANHSIRGNLSFTYNTWTHVALQYNDQTKQQVRTLSSQSDSRIFGNNKKLYKYFIL